jgi:hypothetical protein
MKVVEIVRRVAMRFAEFCCGIGRGILWLRLSVVRLFDDACLRGVLLRLFLILFGLQKRSHFVARLVFFLVQLRARGPGTSRAAARATECPVGKAHDVLNSVHMRRDSTGFGRWEVRVQVFELSTQTNVLGPVHRCSLSRYRVKLPARKSRGYRSDWVAFQRHAASSMHYQW